MAKKDKKKEDETKKVVAKCDPSCYKKQVSDGSRRQTIS